MNRRLEDVPPFSIESILRCIVFFIFMLGIGHYIENNYYKEIIEYPNWDKYDWSDKAIIYHYHYTLGTFSNATVSTYDWITTIEPTKFKNFNHFLAIILLGVVFGLFVVVMELIKGWFPRFKRWFLALIVVLPFAIYLVVDFIVFLFSCQYIHT